MSNPVPGKTYIVVVGDTLSGIAAKAYGNTEKWPVIWNANQQQIKSGDPDLIYPGEVLFIPEDQLRESLKSGLQENKLAQKDPDLFTLVIENREVPVLNGRVFNAMDIVSGSWTATIEWVPGIDEFIDRVTLPYTYPKAQVYLGKNLVNTGFIYDIETNLSESGRTKILTGFSKTVDAIDSTIRPPYQEEKVTLKQRTETLFKNYGLTIEYELENNSQFDRVTAEPTEKIIEHLRKLVSQRGALISDTPEGNILIYKASELGSTVGTLEEGKPGVLSWAGKWNGRERFSVYKAIAQTAKSNASNAVSTDSNIPKSRFLTFQANDTIPGNIQDSADWKRSKSVADSLSQALPVDSWYAPNGELWKENTYVTVISETLHIPDGYKFLIKSVEYSFSEGGTTAVLNIVPPGVYTGQEVVNPWQ